MSLVGRPVLVPAALALVLLACPSAPPSGTADAGAVGDTGVADDAGIVADPLVLAVCEVLSRCAAALGPAFAYETDCQRYMAARYACDRAPGAVNSTAQQACLSWLESATCDDPAMRFGCVALAAPLRCSDPLAQWGSRGAPGCGHVFTTPFAAEGESCETLPCGEDLYCRRGPTSSICPICARLGERDEECLELPAVPQHRPCQPELRCDDVQDVCLGRLTDGEECGADGDCASDFCRDGRCAAPLAAGAAADLLALDQCAGFLVWRDGACLPRLASGEPCTYDVQCFLDAACVAGSCAPAEACGPREVGEPCVTAPLGCVEGAFCNDTETPQRCDAVRGLGESCQFTEDCGDDAYCGLQSWVCTAYGGVDANCAGEALCEHDLYCDFERGDRCTARREDGAACDYNFQCASGHCDGSASHCAPAPACSMP